MEPIDGKRVEMRLREWEGRDLYVHLEVNPGAYWRNGRARLLRGHARGGGPVRVFLELDGGAGLIHADDLTHMELSPDLLICTGYDEHGRLARTLEVGTAPFPM